MIIDTKKIEKLLASPISGDRIEASTGIGKKTISNYRTGNAKLSNMTLETAAKLCAFWIDEESKELSAIKITGVKKAVGEFNQWQGAARIYFNKKKLSVETILYSNSEEASRYQYGQEEIVEVIQKATHDIQERDNRITMHQLQELCENML